MKLKRGYSLIEIMVAMGIFAMIMAMGTAIVATSVRNSTKSEGLNRVRQDLDNIMDRASRDIKNSRSIGECTSWYVLYEDVETKSNASYACATLPGSLYSINHNGQKLTSDSTTISKCQIICTRDANNQLRSISFDIQARDFASQDATSASYAAKYDIFLKNTQ